MEPIDWPMLYAWALGQGSIPDRCFLLTFDDGLADHAERVVPILRDRGIRGVFFVPGAVLAGRRLLPAHAIHLLLSTLDDHTLERGLLELLADRAGEDTARIASMDMAAAQAMYHYETEVRARLKYLLTMVLPIGWRTEAVDTLFEQHIGSAERWARHWYLSWDDLAQMQSFGHTIGGHGDSHEPYSRLTPSECREDMRRVSAVLRGGLGPGIRPFSYPYGQFNDDTCAACRATGFAQAFTTEARWLTKDTDAFRFPRVDAIDLEAMLQETTPCARA
jgi:peptidoglycan/xylan/chitin deacetylase (PgdA/CDA1 family)